MTPQCALFAVATYRATVYRIQCSSAGDLSSGDAAGIHGLPTFPHARVECIECHIGPGAVVCALEISGSYQLLAVTSTLSAPYPTPVHNLRPARETCEDCIGRRSFQATNWSQDHLLTTKRTPHKDSLLVHVGGRSSDSQLVGFMGGTWLVTYERPMISARYPFRQLSKPDGLSANLFPSSISERLGTSRTTHHDCMDCHNRPTHTFECRSQPSTGK